MTPGRSNLVAATLVVLGLAVPGGPLPPEAAAAPPCTITGSEEDDPALAGTGGDDVICALGGNDTVHAGGGNDVVYGGPGVDVLRGDGGADHLDGGADGGTLDGGQGPDACVNGTRVSCFPVSPPDRNDGRGYLDVRRVKTDFDGSKPAWTVVTRGRWSLRRLWDEGFFIVYLDTSGPGDPEYYLLARSSNGRRLDGDLYRERSGTDTRLGPAAASKTGRRSARLRIGLGRLEFGSGRAYFRWSVLTMLLNGPCARTCFDRVTNEGALTQPRLG